MPPSVAAALPHLSAVTAPHAVVAEACSNNKYKSARTALLELTTLCFTGDGEKAIGAKRRWRVNAL